MTDKVKWFKRWLRSKDEQVEPLKPENAQIHLSELEFSDGTKIGLEKNSILILTGPNNVGKSSVLRELRDSLIEGFSKRVVLKTTKFSALALCKIFLRLYRTKA